MLENGDGVVAGPAAGISGAPNATLDTAQVRGWREALGQLALEVAGDAGAPSEPDDAAARAAQALALIGELESLTAAAAAAQAALAVRVDRCRRAEETARGVPARRRGQGVAAELGLARRVSGNRGARMLGLGKALTAEMPCTFAALARGELTEWRATLLARETACLPIEDRAAVDRELCADPATLAGKGDRAVAAAAKQAAYRLDPHSVVRRNELAVNDRRVWLTPAPDQMTYLTALLPLTQGMATYAALVKAAESARATGAAQSRGRGQVMADELVSRVTGLEDRSRVPVCVNLVMTDATLFGGDDEPGLVPGYGPVPAHWAREQVTEGSPQAEIRRLYTAPGGGALIAMDSQSRQVPPGLAEFIRLRDQGTCRVPWCDAPIRHVDHIIPVEHDGQTIGWNLQGTCEAHNYAKQAPGWQMTPLTGGGLAHEVEIRTPSGTIYRSRAPAPPGSDRAAEATAVVTPRAAARTRARPAERRNRKRRAANAGPGP